MLPKFYHILYEMHQPCCLFVNFSLCTLYMITLFVVTLFYYYYIKLYKGYSQVNTHKYFFANRICDIWNTELSS